MTAYSVHLFDVSAKQLIEAELLDEIGDRQLIDWQFQWRPAVSAYLKRLTDKGVPQEDWPQSWHWNWRDKMGEVRGLINHTGYSVVCRDVTQGLMRLDLGKYRARLDSQRGKHLVYVDYLEVAPWNWREPYADAPIYQLIGQVLIHAAITRSVNEGYHGRVGLHSLPQAIGFYERCGFNNLGTNPGEYGGRLPYCEISPEAAEKYLKGDL